MEKLTLNIKSSEKKIDIYSGKSALYACKKAIEKLPIRELIVLSNYTVWNLWSYKLKEFIKFEEVFLLPDGEKYKNLNSVNKAYSFLSSKGATRKTALVTFGGGVIGDVGGFVASTYHRGIPLIHIPTTLLSQVDSSIGGKTGYNLKEGKNLIGTFYHPLMIVSDSMFLKTLPNKEFLSGLAEVIKAALIMDERLFNFLEKNLQNILDRDEEALSVIISNAQAVKIKVVEKDEKEVGLRAILNLGHTLGHAIETIKKYKISHGYAVVAGIGFVAYMSLLKGYLKENDLIRILNFLKVCGYKIYYPLHKEILIQTLNKDKKRKEELIEWVLLKGIGRASIGEKLSLDFVSYSLDTYEMYLKNKIY